MMDVMGGVLSECPINIVNNDQNCGLSSKHAKVLGAPKTTSFSGLFFKCMSADHTCAVIAKLSAEVKITPEATSEQTTISVSMAALVPLLKSIDRKYSLQLYFRHGSTKMYIKSATSCKGGHFSTKSLETLEYDQPEFAIDDIRYHYTVELDLNTFHNIIRVANSLKSSYLRIRVYEQAVGTRSFFVTNTYGESSSDENVFLSDTKVQDEAKVFSVHPPDDNDVSGVDPATISRKSLVCKYNGVFAVQYIESLLKHLEDPTVILRLSADADTPMTLTSVFGDEDSFVSFVLASKNDEEFPDELESFKP